MSILRTRRILCALALLLGLSAVARADIASDYAAIRGSLNPVVGPPGAAVGGLLLLGRTSFPLLVDPKSGRRLAAASLYNDAASGARGAFIAHDGYYNTSDASRAALLENLAQWSGRGARPLVGVARLAQDWLGLYDFFRTRGYPVRLIDASAANLTENGTRVAVYFAMLPTPASASNVQAFAASGGGLVLSTTPWALSQADWNATNTMLLPFGMGLEHGYDDVKTIGMPAGPYSLLHSALRAADALKLDRSGQSPLTLEDKRVAADAVSRVYHERGDITALNALLDPLSTSYGWITPTRTAPIVRETQPVEVMLAYYQWRTKLDVIAPSQMGTLFLNGQHPAASDYPGLPAPGNPVNKTIAVNGNTPDEVFMNQSERPTRIETGMYAAPGAVVTISLPAEKASAGLRVHVGQGEDDAFGLGRWDNFPVVHRRFPLNASTNVIGHVFGGLITLLVPPGSNLGTFNVSISGALEAPAFELNVNTDAQWNGGLKTCPGAWGYLKTPRVTVYAPRYQLEALASAQKVASHWESAMVISDLAYGYEGQRKRSEVVALNRQVSAGSAYAGYPNEMGGGVDVRPGNDGEVFVESMLLDGDWGAYHELGHNFQADFADRFRVPIGAEVDVNINPSVLYAVLHDHSPWDAPLYIAGPYYAADRIAARQGFFALPLAEQTWLYANPGTLEDPHPYAMMSYDFYYNLVESFGWGVFRKPFLRLMTYLKSANPQATDPELFGLDNGDPNAVRNRFYFLLCVETQRDLTSYFARYGLRAGGAEHGLTPSVVSGVQGRGLRVWDGNQPMTALSNPGTRSIAETTAPDTAIYTFTTTDQDPGESFTYEITAGNSDGAFALDRKSGVLKVGPRGLDYERRNSYALTVKVSGFGIPFAATTRPTLSRSFTVNVSNVADAPQTNARLFTANSSQSSGTTIGTLSATLQSWRTVRWSIVGGNASGAISLTAGGSLRLSSPSSLPNPGVLELVVRATDNTGAFAEAPVKIVCNSALGLSEERWSGANVFTGTPVYSGALTSFTSAVDVADNYSRRLRGYIVPVVSGLYTFGIASDDMGKLYLSTDADPANKTLIARAPEWTASGGFTKFKQQTSRPIALTAGKAYYIEATHIEGSQVDHLTVRWQTPEGTVATIPQSALVPFKPGITFAR